MSGLGKQVVLYQDPDGSISLEVKFEAETVWLSLNQMAELFGRDKSVISRHLRKVFRVRGHKKDPTLERQKE